MLLEFCFFLLGYVRVVLLTILLKISGVRKAGFRPGVEPSPVASKRENLLVPRGGTGSDDPSPAGVKTFLCVHFPAKSNGNGYLNSKIAQGPTINLLLVFFGDSARNNSFLINSSITCAEHVQPLGM